MHKSPIALIRSIRPVSVIQMNICDTQRTNYTIKSNQESLHWFEKSTFTLPASLCVPPFEYDLIEFGISFYFGKQIFRMAASWMLYRIVSNMKIINFQ